MFKCCSHLRRTDYKNGLNRICRKTPKTSTQYLKCRTRRKRRVCRNTKWKHWRTMANKSTNVEKMSDNVEHIEKIQKTVEKSHERATVDVFESQAPRVPRVPRVARVARVPRDPRVTPNPPGPTREIQVKILRYCI